jgi:hypothetical protein
MIDLHRKVVRLARWSVGAAFVLLATRLIAGCSSTNGSGAGDKSRGTLTLQITTGGDSLRLDSTAAATVVYKDGSQDVIALPSYRKTNNAGAGTQENFGASSTTTITSDLSSAQPIASIHIGLVSHPDSLFESNDDWTIQEVRAAVSQAGSLGQCVLDRAGASVTDGEPLTVTAGGCASASALSLVVVTGGDGLRPDSTATLRVDYQSGEYDVLPLLQKFQAGGTQQLDLELSSAEPIVRITLAMESHPSGLESADDWDVKHVEAVVDGGDAPMCIVDAPGKTLTDGVSLTLLPDGCPDMTDAGVEGGRDGAGTDGGNDASDEASADAASD